MMIRAASLPVLPKYAVPVKVIDRPRIWISFVEMLDFFVRTKRP
jgi:hypothetical protein